MKKYPPAVEILWLDASVETNWKDISQIAEEAIMLTRGTLIREGGKYTEVTQTISPEDKIANTIAIPRAVIIKIRKLK